MKIIKFKKVTKIYPPETVALKEVSFEVGEGEFVVIAGESGAGKTTLLKLILAQEKPTEGEILINGENINELSPKELSYLRRKIGSIFQDYKLISQKTVGENVSFVLSAISASEEEIEENVPKVLEIVGLAEKKDKFPFQLSTGEKQRAAIARALIHKPQIILADEPTGNLDPSNTREIINLLKRINGFGTSIILATHSRDIIKRLKTRTLLIEDGEILADAGKGKVLI